MHQTTKITVKQATQRVRNNNTKHTFGAKSKKVAKMTPETKTDMENTQSSPGRTLLRSWLNKHLKVVLSDGRILVGVFLCTDQNSNVILGSCTESTPEQSEGSEPRILGLAMVPGRHILSVHVDEF